MTIKPYQGRIDELASKCVVKPKLNIFDRATQYALRVTYEKISAIKSNR